MTKSLLIFILSIFTTFTAFAQSKNYSKDNSTIKIEGTSSLHDWHCDVNDVTGNADVTVDGDKVTAVNGLDLTFVVKGIKSGKGAMDKNIYSALKEKSNPTITFKSTSATIDANGAVKAQGQLTIAGTTKDVTLVADASVEGGKVKFEGKTTFNMSAYNVDPPTAMFGTITTGDEVTIDYSASFN
ncbi:YceI family protein [Flammeovirga aprica]|uniref:YceI family protein n=1 Tax=Flammeovirga aprica JL-4 TaxID=694437 RepID=A0A7X9XBW3_9BACT|nr:YceI family protein [Flammeovirga aprica]NME71140.1 YceI family protein [Flammeovirga aprica JL-4]